MKNPFKSYRQVEGHILWLVFAQGALQLINSAFILVLPIYMQNEGFEDHEVAATLKFRFAGVLLLALPFGLYIKGRRLHPWLLISSIMVPAISFGIIEAVDAHNVTLLYWLKAAWGVFFMLFSVSILPYILRNANPLRHTEAIALSFSTWSFATVVSGILIFSLQRISPEIFNEKVVIQVICGTAFLSFVFALFLARNRENIPKAPRIPRLSDYDWRIIGRAVVPNILIAIGAGMTIPFISLYFNNIFGLDSAEFSLIAMGATVIVFFAVTLVPSIKNRWGFQKAIPATQAVAIVMLAGLATTEYFHNLWFALPLAIAFYVLRQPLMTVAAPMTSEFTMKYVGKRNEEIMSALNASIWSGSWFFSGWFFQEMREAEIAYSSIFFITVSLYALAVGTYVILLRDHAKREKSRT